MIPESPEVAGFPAREQERQQRLNFDYWGRSYWYDVNGRPITVEQWGALREASDPHIASTRIYGPDGHVCWVSTVWLGMNHAFSPDMPPIIFETMVFMDRDWGGLDFTERYSTKLWAKRGHKVICRMVRKMMKEIPRPKQLISNGRKP